MLEQSDDSKQPASQDKDQDRVEQHPMQQASQNSELWYRQLVNTLRDGLAIFEAQGTILFANAAFSRMYGYSQAQLMRMQVPELIHPDHRHVFQRFTAELEQKGHFTGQTTDVRSDGTTFYAEVKGTRIQFNGQACALAVVRDITDRRQVQQRLAESEEKYRQLAETINEWVWEVDQNGTYTYASPRVQDLLGYQPDEVLGKTPFDFMPPEEANRVREDFVSYFQQKIAFERLENINIRKDGQRVILETSGNPKLDKHGEVIGYRGIDRDITERKQAERAHQESEKRLRRLIDAAPYGALEYELCEADRLVFIGYNQAANRILGTDCRQFIGKTLEEAFPPLAHTPIPEAYRKVATTGEPYEDDQVMYEDDRIRGAFEIVAFQTAPQCMAVLFRDVTERRRAEEKVMDYQNQLRALVSQLTLSEERERKNLAVELHDGICQSLAMAKLKVDEQLADYSADAVHTLLQELQNSLIGIIDEARSLTNNLGTPMLQTVGLSAALEKWLDTEVTAKYGIKTNVIDKGVPRMLDEDTKALLFRAVRELAVNVVKHAKAQTITVTMETQSEELLLETVDDGKGFSPHTLSPQNSNAGGYGLFSIHERIIYISGSMTIDSAPGKGTRILLRVPVAGCCTED